MTNEFILHATTLLWDLLFGQREIFDVLLEVAAFIFKIKYLYILNCSRGTFLLISMKRDWRMPGHAITTRAMGQGLRAAGNHGTKIIFLNERVE